MNIGIIGGTGMSQLFTEQGLHDEAFIHNLPGGQEVQYTIFHYHGHRLIFVDRHMSSGVFRPPHLLDHQSYMQLMYKEGVKAILASSAVGASHIKGGFSQGKLVVPNDAIDYVQEAYTFSKEGFTHPTAFHRPIDHLFCPQLVAALRGVDHFDMGRYVLANSIKGPRFESLAEMQVRVRDGVHLVGMPTAFPEAVLAGELAIPYAVLCGVSNMAPAKHDGQSVKEVMTKLVPKMADRMLQAVDSFLKDGGHDPDCLCRQDREEAVFDQVFS